MAYDLWVMFLALCFWLLVPVCVLILTKRVRIGWLRGILLWLGLFYALLAGLDC